jgi:hypothetical protein
MVTPKENLTLSKKPSTFLITMHLSVGSLDQFGKCFHQFGELAKYQSNIYLVTRPFCRTLMLKPWVPWEEFVEQHQLAQRERRNPGPCNDQGLFLLDDFQNFLAFNFS